MKVHEFMQKMNQLLKTTSEIGDCDIVVEELKAAIGTDKLRVKE